jgi:hypothetical protein
VVLGTIRVDDATKAERAVCDVLSSRFVRRTDYGAEYFEGALADVATLFFVTAMRFASDACHAPMEIAPTEEDADKPPRKRAKRMMDATMKDLDGTAARAAQSSMEGR